MRYALALFAAANAQDARFFSDPVGYVTTLEQEVKMLRASHSHLAAAAKPCPACPACPAVAPSPVVDVAADTGSGETVDAHDLAMELQVCTAQLQASERRAQAAIQAQDEVTSDANTAHAQVTSLQSANEALTEKLRMAESGEHTSEAEQDWEQEKALDAQWRATVEKLQAENTADEVALELARTQEKDAYAAQERVLNETHTLNASLQVTNHLNAQLTQLLRACADHEGMLDQQVAANKPAMSALAGRAEAAEAMVQKLQFANVALEDETAQSQSALADGQAAIKSMRAQSSAEITRANASIAAVESEDAQLRKHLQAARTQVKRLQARVDAAEATAQEAKASAVAEAKSAEHARAGEADAVRRLTEMRKTADSFASQYKGAEARSEARAAEAEKKVEHVEEELKEEETLLNSAESKAKLADQRAEAAAAEAATKLAAAKEAAAKEAAAKDAAASASLAAAKEAAARKAKSDAKSSEAKSSETKSSEAKSSAAKSSAAKSSEAKSSESTASSQKKARLDRIATEPRKVSARPASLLARQPPPEPTVVEPESDSAEDEIDGEVEDIDDLDA
jgi:hypothetical protein